MRSKITVFLSVLLLTLLAPAGILYAHGGSDGQGGDDRIRIEARDDGNRVHIEVRGGVGAEGVEVLPKFEVEGNTFEITGEVTAFTGGTVTVGGQAVTIDPGAVANFEQEGTIDVGEVIKVEGFVEDGGALTAREIKADGVDVEEEVEDGVEVEGANVTSLLNQIIAFLQSLM